VLDKISKRWLYAILALCLLLRIGLSIYSADAEVTRDAYNYVRIAQHLADGKGFAVDEGYGGSGLAGKDHLTAYGNPIYPAFLAAIYMSVGDSIGPIPSVSVVQSVLDTITCLLIFLFTCRLLNRPKVALVAALLYAIYPPFILNVATPMTETLTTGLTVLAAFLLIQAIGRGIGRFALAGALMGLLILLKPAMLAFPFAVALLLFTLRKQTGGWVARSVVYICVAYLIVCPWTLRNYRVFHAFVPVATQGGQTFWGGTGPADGVSIGAWAYPVASVKGPPPADDRIPVVSEQTYRKITTLQERLGRMNEVQQDRTLVAEAKKEIRQHPGRYAFLAVKKFIRLWFNLWYDFPASSRSYGIAAINAVLLLLAVFGYRRTKLDYRFKLVSLYLCGYTTVISMLVQGNVRYSWPVMPFVIILGASYIAAVMDRNKQAVAAE
jgi:4-amino-4-deoxy-L-arabinose transferase-like glycosyltransferase